MATFKGTVYLPTTYDDLIKSEKSKLNELMSKKFKLSTKSINRKINQSQGQRLDATQQRYFDYLLNKGAAFICELHAKDFPQPETVEQ